MEIPKSFRPDQRNFIRNFYKKFPEHKQFWDKTSTKPFTNVLKQFHNDIIDTVIENRHGVDLPLFMGNLSIISYKANKQPLNFTKYTKLKQISNFTNNHTDGLSCKILYTSYLRKYRFKDKRIWAFHPEKPFQRKVSKAFSEHYNRYIYSPNTAKNYYQLLDIKKQDEIDLKVEKFLLTYDEFYLE